MSPVRVFIFLAAILGLAHAAVTPPLRVPDEVTHFWRAVSVSRGTFVPKAGPRGAVAPLPSGFRELAFVYLVDAKVSRDDVRVAREVELHEELPVELPFVASYTPVAYTPQILAAFITRLFHARPFFVFYAGRLAALAAYIALIALAIRITPHLPWAFVAAALLPMSLSLAASWSADAMAIALAFLLTAALLRKWQPLIAFLLGLVKPGYFLIAVMTWRRWLTVVAAIAGSAISIYAASQFPAPTRGSTSMQWLCIRSHPLATFGIVLRDYAENAFTYLEQMVGRLGLLDVFLPMWALWLAWLLLAAIAFTAGERIPRATRIGALLATIATLLGTSFTLYVTWTSPCAPVVEGVQGRYFIPILPMALFAIGNPWWKGKRIGAFAVAIVSVVVNVAALYAMIEAAY